MTFTSSNEYLGQEEFQVALRPGRVAYLIASESVDGYRRAVQGACTRWGGVSEPICTVNEDGTLPPFWKQVIELANVDAIVVVDADFDAGIKIAFDLGLSAFTFEHIIYAGLGQMTCYPSVVNNDSGVSDVSTPWAPHGLKTLWTCAESTASLWAITANGTLSEEVVDEVKVSGEPIVIQKIRCNWPSLKSAVRLFSIGRHRSFGNGGRRRALRHGPGSFGSSKRTRFGVVSTTGIDEHSGR